MTFTSDTQYKNWSVIDITDIPDCNSKGIYLRHKISGLEVYHLLNDDEENLFAFAFRTPPDDSAGEAHILEHSVLCGSENYPLKDPFVRLVNQSVKTFLNAMTFPDKTVYPASSQIKADYFNLMSVYGDAVFFPRLDPEIFSQEAHRLEIDKDGKYAIQGVVYNEMKGNYSSFDSVAGDASIRSLFPNTIYALDSGGDPLVIPNITHKQLKAFHQKYYRADNCLVFLYGNIPTDEQLDFLEEKFLTRIEKKNQSLEKPLPPLDIDAIVAREKVQPFSKPIFREETGPAFENKNVNSTVMENWVLCEASDIKSYMECVFLSDVLCGHDGSPLIKALLESGLGEDIAPNTGMMAEMFNVTMSIGLRGVESAKIQAVEKIIFKTLNDLSINGIPKEDIDSAIMSVNFSNREIKRANGPYSLILMRRALHSWTYGKHPSNTLLIRQTFAEIEQNIKSDPDYISNLIKKYLISNIHRSLTSVTPDSNYLKERDMFEQSIISSKKNAKTAEEIQKENDLLHTYQQKVETEEDAKCIPYLKSSDLAVKIEHIKTQEEKLNANNEEITFLINKEPTNGIVYFDLAFPVDNFSESEYPLVPLFTTAVTNCGWQGKTWAETAGLIARTCGGFAAMPITSSVPKNHKPKIYTERDLLVFRIKMLTEKTKEALDLLSDCLNLTDFSDTKRILDLLNEYRNDFDESVIPAGNDYAAMRASCKVNRSKAVDEIWNGITQLFMIHKIDDMQFLSTQFAQMLKKMKEAGAILHITADEKSLETVRPLLPEFVTKTNICALKPKQATEEIDFFKMVELPTKNSADTAKLQYPEAEILLAPSSQAGFAACVFEASTWLTKEAEAETVLAHILSTTILWEQLRTIGGAYGAFASSDAVEKTFTLVSYRDPTPLNTPERFMDCLKMMESQTLSKDSLEKAIAGCFSKVIQPRSPSSRGFTGFLRSLYNITAEDREKKIELLFSLTNEDIHNAVKRLISQMENVKIACLSGTEKDDYGKIILLPM